MNLKIMNQNTDQNLVEHFIHLFIADRYISRFCLTFLVVKLQKTYPNMSRGLGQISVLYKM